MLLLMATSFHGEALGKMGESSFSQWLENGWAWNATMGIPARSGSILVLAKFSQLLSQPRPPDPLLPTPRVQVRT